MTASAPVTASPPRTANPFGLVSFLLAAALVLLGIATRILTYTAPSFAASTGASAASIGLIFTVTGVVGLLIGIAAVVLGIVGVTRPTLPHALAGAGMAVGVFQVVSWIVGTISTPIVAGLVVPR